MVYLPYLNTKDALSLSPQQWFNLGIKAFAVDFELLLQRFGSDNGFKLKQFAMPWAQFLLDLRAIDRNQPYYSFRSLDGRLQQLEIAALLAWVDQLGADQLVFHDSDFGHFQPSHLPVQDTMSGHFYSQSQTWSIVDAVFANDFTALSPNCHCATCLQGATRGYLHYLFQSTPLLAQRYLLIHNISQYQE